MAEVGRTAVQLYRDCLRLVKHMAGNSAKGHHLKALVGSEFRKNMDEQDEEKVANLKTKCVTCGCRRRRCCCRCHGGYDSRFSCCHAPSDT